MPTGWCAWLSTSHSAWPDARRDSEASVTRSFSTGATTRRRSSTVAGSPTDRSWRGHPAASSNCWAASPPPIPSRRWGPGPRAGSNALPQRRGGPERCRAQLRRLATPLRLPAGRPRDDDRASRFGIPALDHRRRAAAQLRAADRTGDGLLSPRGPRQPAPVQRHHVWPARSRRGACSIRC